MKWITLLCLALAACRGVPMLDIDGMGFTRPPQDDAAPETRKRIIVIAGQSNGHGIAVAANITIRTGYTLAYANVTQKQKWASNAVDPPTFIEPATAALAPRGGSPNFGPELSLGRYVDLAIPTKFAISKFNGSGYSLAVEWNPNGTYPTGTNFFDQWLAYMAASETELSGYIAAIVWIQGEADAEDAGEAAAYEANLTAFIATVRETYPNIPFVISYLHASGSGAHSATVRTAQENVVAAMAQVSGVDVDDLTLADGLHFDADSYVLLGDRLAAAALTELGINEKPLASFTHNGTSASLTVDFTDTSTDSDGVIASWLWDFGDGSTSTAQNPSRTYASANAYFVTLTITDNGGAAVVTTQWVNILPWTVDLGSGKGIPANTTEWDEVLDAAGLGGVVAAPDGIVDTQVPSGSPTDTAGRTWTASGTGLGYNSSVSGWNRKALITSNAGTGTFSCTDAALPDMSAGNVTIFSIANMTTSTALARSMLVAGTSPIDYTGGQTAQRMHSAANQASGASSVIGVVRPWWMVSGTTRAAARTDLEKVTPTNGANTGKAINMGAGPGIVSSAGGLFLYTCYWHSALTDAQIKSISQVLGWTIPWT